MPVKASRPATASGVEREARPAPAHGHRIWPRSGPVPCSSPSPIARPRPRRSFPLDRSTPMRLLAFETSTARGSLAALDTNLDQSPVIVELSLPDSARTAQSLAPLLQSLLEQASWKAADVELVAVANGPGSFTGLRIGVTTAKTFAYATGAHIIGVNTLDSLAQRVPATDGTLWAVMDAQRQELFASSFRLDDNQRWRTHRPVEIWPRDSWLAQLQQDDWVTGPVLQRLASQLRGGAQSVAAEWWLPTATAVGELAWTQFQAGRRDDVWQLVPDYYRPSAAEEKWAQKNQE